ncbi:MAG: hypothetical protein HXY50_14220 [Ignavibacteriaceae bacterium]|nr:hypothetical protein [Ignavibacteriaceae bacterium]
MLKSIAIKLGFAEDFYEETIKNLLVNEHISEEPIKFSNSKIAFSFVSDGLRLAHSDQKIHQVEIQWLRKTAVINNIDETKFEQLIESNKEATDKKSHSEYALFSII